VAGAGQPDIEAQPAVRRLSVPDGQVQVLSGLLLNWTPSPGYLSCSHDAPIRPSVMVSRMVTGELHQPAAVPAPSVGAERVDRRIAGPMPLEADPWPLMMAQPRTWLFQVDAPAYVDPTAIGGFKRVIMQAMK
jgi:hypothetical protein